MGGVGRGKIDEISIQLRPKQSTHPRSSTFPNLIPLENRIIGKLTATMCECAKNLNFTRRVPASSEQEN